MVNPSTGVKVLDSGITQIPLCFINGGNDRSERDDPVLYGY
jgi:hypothetical protein